MQGFAFDAVLWDFVKEIAPYFGAVLIAIAIMILVLNIDERKNRSYRLKLARADYDKASNIRVLRSLIRSLIARSVK